VRSGDCGNSPLPVNQIRMPRSLRCLRIIPRQCASTTCNSRSGLHLLQHSPCHSSDRHSCTRWPSAWRSQCILTLLKSRQACSSFGCCHLFARPYVCSLRLIRIEVSHDTAIGGAFGSVLGRACSCGCLVGNRKTECSTQVCNGHRCIGDPDLGSLFCFQPGPFLTRCQGISQYHARRALVWLD